MDLQFYGANCIGVTYKGARIVVDDNLTALGSKSVTKPEDVALFTANRQDNMPRLTFDGPGEYEVSEVSITGIAARAHTDEEDQLSTTMFKLVAGDQSILISGHVYPNLTEAQLESIGIVDVLVVPVGGNGYTVDPVGALKLIKDIEPKLVIPTHYADKDFKYPMPQQELSSALKEISMEPKETLAKLRLKPAELNDITQLIILERTK